MAEDKQAEDKQADDKQADEDYGHHLFPQRDGRNPKKESLMSKLHFLKFRCQARLNISMEKNPMVKILLDSMERAGCTAYKDRHFSCEDCDTSVGGGFDSTTCEVVICQNTVLNQPDMDRMLTHELIHAYDHCRAQVDFLRNIKHLACTEIRAASLSGDCTFANEVFRFNFGIKEHHQACVRDRAVRSILAARNVSREAAEKAVDEVFEPCFKDQQPFGRIPYNRSSANMAYKEHKNWRLYYADL